MAFRSIDLTGQKFNRLLVLGLAPVAKTRNDRWWDCVCDCGQTITVTTNHLTSNHTRSCGCFKTDVQHARHNIIGMKFNRLTVVAEGPRTKTRRLTWKCECICGNFIFLQKHQLVAKNPKGLVQSCGCLQIDKAYSSRLLPRGEAVFNRVYEQYINGARSRNHEWGLTKEDAIRMFQSRCHYCGVEPSKLYVRPGAYKDVYYNGIDRVDSSAGYTPQNTVPCCSICNQAKHTHPVSVFLNWAQRLYSYQQSLST